MLHRDRGRAESFGTDAAAYHAERPSYPAELVDALCADAPADALDVGCGTGILALALLERGVRVTGVEPDARMAAEAARHGVAVEEARFEAWDAGERRFDLLASGQAWHWVDPSAGADRAAALLRPGGRIGLAWNLGRPSATVRAAMAAAYVDEPGLERHSVLLGHQDDRLDVAAAGLDATGAFGPARRHVWRWTRRYDADGWVRHLFTHSDHAALPPARRDALAGRVRDAVAGLGGTLAMDYDAVVLTARRTA